MQKTKICIKNIKTIKEKNYIENYSLLTKIQKNKIDKLKIITDKKLSLLGLMILKSVYKCEYKDIYYINGKPNINGQYFSVSHKEPYTIVITSNNLIGIDIEKIAKVNDNTLKFLNEKNNIEALIKWTKIESYFKCFNNFLLDINKAKNAKFKTVILNKKYIITICKKAA